MREQPKVFEYAKEIGMEPLALMDKIREWNLPVKSHMVSLSTDIISEIERHLNKESTSNKKAKKKKVTKKKAAKKKTTETTKKKTTSKVVTKKEKTVIAKSITKKTVKSKPQSEESTKKVKKTVIRRRAKSEVEEPVVTGQESTRLTEDNTPKATTTSVSPHIEDTNTTTGPSNPIASPSPELTQKRRASRTPRKAKAPW